MLSAQTATRLAVIQGNGQMPCPTCGSKNFRTFFPLVVRVLDANGAPIAGKTVNWQVTAAVGPTPFVDSSSVSDSSGYAQSNYFQAFQGGSASTPFLQGTVLATADSASATFYVTQALTDNSAGAGNVQLVFTRLDSPPIGNIGYELSGAAGGTSSVPIKIHVDGNPTPVPNVSVRIQITDPKAVPSATCVGAPGADPGSVLTDANGDAVCNVVFGPVPGQGSINVLVGGLDPANYSYPAGSVPVPLDKPLAFSEYDNILLTVTPVTASKIQVSSGNNQSINPGATTSPLVALVTDSTGTVPVANAGVTWTVSPSTGATLSSTTTTSNGSGLAQVTLALAPAATGTFTVKAALTSVPSASATFTVNTNVQITSLTKVSGDSQTVAANQNFAAPLVVQVNGNSGQPLPNVIVNFSASGAGTVLASSATTDGNGRAQVTAKAGAAAGTLTVVASVANISQTFTLTVVPPGPGLTTSSFVNAAGGPALSPCSLATAIATGLAPGLNGLVLQPSAFGPWATTLAGDTVTVNNVAAPIFSVGTVSGAEQVTFQIPCEASPATSVPVTISVSGGSASANITLLAAGPGIYETVMSDKVKRAVVIRPDGSFVSLQNPARRGEVVRVLVTGMGPTTPSVATGALPVPGSDALVTGQVIVGVNNAGTRVVTSRLSPNLIGVYEIAFQVPSDAPTNNDVVLSVAVNAPGDAQTRFSNGSKIPIQ